jgi:hypothetical protein
VREPYEGRVFPGGTSVTCWEEARQRPIDTLGRKRGTGESPGISQARERRQGEIPAKAFAGGPWKGETQGSNQRSAP